MSRLWRLRTGIEKMDIRYLQNEEKQKSRELYECCFPEDSRQFVDYYYKEKCWDNAIWVAEEQGRIVSMIHENPFTVSLCGHPVPVHYVVAVATLPEYRRQGLMRTLLERMLRNASRRGEPFSFLMPANPAYYEPFGYRYWNSQIEWKMEEAMTDRMKEICTNWNFGDSGCAPLSKYGAEQLAAFANDVLDRNFDLYVRRDRAYYERLRLEQQSEQGDVIVMRDEDGTCVGCFCFDREDGISIREPILRQNAEERKHALMMGRIVNLEQFVKSLHFPEPFEETICITDDIIPENNGCFRFQIEKGQSTAARAETHDTARTMDIAEFGQFLFDRLRIFVNEIV